MKLLTKGVFGSRSTVELYRQDQLRFMGNGALTFALYFKDPATHQKIQGWVEEDGSLDHVFETFDGSSIAVAVPVA